MPLFSIIVPVYNVAPYLKECLDSLLDHDFKDFEVCVVDDGSTDGSDRICEEYKNRYSSHIKLRHQENQGVSVARNNALDMANGKYIWFVDADDYIQPGALGFLAEVIMQCDCDTIFFGSSTLDKSAVVSYESGGRNSFLASHICYCNPLMIFSRSIIETYGLRFTVGMRMAEDLEFQYKYLLHCKYPVSVDYNFYHIRVREGSASRNQDSCLANYESSKVFLSNMIEYLAHVPDKGVQWMTPRISERLKSYLQSALRLSGIDRRELQRQFTSFVKAYEALGYVDLAVGSLRIALVNINFYNFLYRLIIKFKYK